MLSLSCFLSTRGENVYNDIEKKCLKRYCKQYTTFNCLQNCTVNDLKCWYLNISVLHISKYEIEKKNLNKCKTKRFQIHNTFQTPKESKIFHSYLFFTRLNSITIP